MADQLVVNDPSNDRLKIVDPETDRLSVIEQEIWTLDDATGLFSPSDRDLNPTILSYDWSDEGSFTASSNLTPLPNGRIYGNLDYLNYDSGDPLMIFDFEVAPSYLAISGNVAVAGNQGLFSRELEPKEGYLFASSCSGTFNTGVMTTAVAIVDSGGDFLCYAFFMYSSGSTRVYLYDRTGEIASVPFANGTYGEIKFVVNPDGTMKVSIDSTLIGDTATVVTGQNVKMLLASGNNVFEGRFRSARIDLWA